MKVDEAFETVSSPLAAGFVAVNIFLYVCSLDSISHSRSTLPDRTTMYARDDTDTVILKFLKDRRHDNILDKTLHV